MGEKYLAAGEWVGMDMRVPYISATLVGVVRDGTSLAPISHATVAVSAGAEGARAVAAVTDRFGAFTVPRTPRGPLRVRVSAFGYRPWEGAYEEPLASLVEVLLAPQPIALDSLGVTASIRTRDPLSLSPYAFAVDPAIVRAMPALVESDVLRVLSLSPSASAVADYMAVPYVRGGTGEESYWATDAAESWRDDFDWGSAAVVATTATGRRAGECWTSRRVTAASTKECSNSSGWTSRCLTRSPWSSASWPRIVSTRAASGT